jgi:hypothetical protein
LDQALEAFDARLPQHGSVAAESAAAAAGRLQSSENTMVFGWQV